MRHFYIHDSIGTEDHMVLGTSEVNLKEQLKSNEYMKGKHKMKEETNEGTVGRIEKIRYLEKVSHEKAYTAETLYEGDSWLKKPAKTVVDLLPAFEGNDKLYVLDLGCGVGRNCIPIARKYRNIDCQIDCVDILELAIKHLNEYSCKYGVNSCINGIVLPLEEYAIAIGKYHFILAVSSLEHVKNDKCFAEMLEKIREGVRNRGIVCLIINSDVKEVEKDTGKERNVQFEVNMKTEDMIELLHRNFQGWEILKNTVVKQQYEIPRDKMISLSTDVVTWVARKIAA